MAKREERRKDAMPEPSEGMSDAHTLLMSMPRVRCLLRDGKGGVKHTYYAWDGRTTGHGTIMLGKDPELALEKYRQHEAGSGRQARQHRRFDYGPEHATLPAWAKTMFHNAKARSHANGREFGLTSAQFVALVAAADGHCQLSGIKLDTTAFEDDGRSNPFTPSIDRIDSTRGYVEGNCRIVCLMANLLLAGWGDGPLFQFAEGVCRKRWALGGRDAKPFAEKPKEKPLKSTA